MLQPFHGNIKVIYIYIFFEFFLVGLFKMRFWTGEVSVSGEKKKKKKRKEKNGMSFYSSSFNVCTKWRVDENV